MKKNKGFTLVELMVVMVILIAILLIVVPISFDIFKRSKQQSYLKQIDYIVDAAAIYVADHKDQFKDLQKNKQNYISLYLGSSLETNGYIDKKIKDPRDNKFFSEEFEIKVMLDEYGNYVYETTDPKDSNVPILHIDNTLEVVYIKAGTSYNPLTGVKVFDKKGNDITASSKITYTNNLSLTLDTEKDIVINYTANFQGTLSITKTKIVKVRNDRLPVLTLNGDNPLFGEQYKPLTDPKAKAVNSNNVDITSLIKSTTNINVNKIGEYYINYTVVDDSNYKIATSNRRVIIVGDTFPVVAITGGNINMKQNDTYVEPGYSAYDKVDKSMTAKVTITYYDQNNIATTKDKIGLNKGTYKITYNVTDSNGNKANEIARYIYVE